jgi:hypothetical protein
MFKWLGNLPKALTGNEFREPYTIKIGPLFDLLLDKIEFADEELQTERMRQMSEFIMEKYEKNDHVLLVNFTRYELKTLGHITVVPYGILTNFHYEQLVNMLHMCCLLRSIVEAESGSSDNPLKHENNHNNESLHEDENTFDILSGSGIVDEKMDSKTKNRLHHIIFYCTCENLYYGLLMSACLIYFSTGDKFIENWLNKSLRETQRLFVMNSPRTPRTAQNTVISIADYVTPSLIRYCKFFSSLLQIPMPFATVYTLDRLKMNALFGLCLSSPRISSPRMSSPRGPRSLYTGEGKIYIVVKQNEEEIYGAFFQQQVMKSTNNIASLDNNNSTVIVDENGETWYSYELLKAGQPVHLLGDFVLCCYWVVRDTFTKLFRFTFNTLFIRNETHLPNERQLHLVQPRSKLDWVDGNELVPQNFILQLYFTEVGGASMHLNHNIISASQNYRDSLEKCLKACPYYYLNDQQSTIEHRLAHVVSNNEKHLDNMAFVIRELKSKFISNNTEWLRTVPKEERFDAKWANPKTNLKRTKGVKRLFEGKEPTQESNEPSSPPVTEENGSSFNKPGIVPPLQLADVLSSTAPPPPTPPPPPPPPPPPGTPSAPGAGKLTRVASMKRLDWKPIKRLASETDLNSIWNEMSSEINAAQSLVNEEVEKLKILFAQSSSNMKRVSTPRVEPENLISILPSNVSRNLGIILASQFRGMDDVHQLIKKIMELQPMQPGQISSLYQLITSVTDDIRGKLIKAGCTEYEKLPKSEQFLFHLLTRDRLPEHMKSILYIHTIPELFDQLNEKLQLKLASCYAVRTNEGFKKILAYILAIGNTMNEGRRNLSGVAGFNLDILPKLDGTKANDDSTKSLLHYLAKMIKEKEESVCYFYEKENFEDLVSKSARLGMSTLVQLQKQFSEQKDHLEAEFRYYTKTMKLSDEAMKRLKENAESAIGHYDYLHSLSEDCEQLYLETLDYFHFNKDEIMGEIDPFFTLIDQFIKKFKKACEENRIIEEQELAKLKRKKQLKALKKNEACSEPIQTSDTSDEAPSEITQVSDTSDEILSEITQASGASDEAHSEITQSSGNSDEVSPRTTQASSISGETFVETIQAPDTSNGNSDI